MERFLGIELGGTRRTALVALDFFAAERKVFVKEILEFSVRAKARVRESEPSASVSPRAITESRGRAPGLLENSEKSENLQETETPDELLLQAIQALEPTAIGVDAPLSLPTCLTCQRVCPGFTNCEVDSMRWMREEAVRAFGTRLAAPYTQRPIDLLLRARWNSAEESMGAGRAPLAVRLQYLRKHFHAPLLEVHPRLALQGLAEWFSLSAREVRRARDVEDGAENRLRILEKISAPPTHSALPHLFLYDSDLETFAQDINAFDALLCAWMALMDSLQLLEPPEIPPDWGYVAYPLPPRSAK